MKRIIRVLVLLAIVSVALAACAGEDSGPFGTWLVPTISPAASVGTITGAILTLSEGGAYTLTYTYVPGGAGSHAGTFAPATLPESTTITFTVVSRGANTLVEPPLGSTWTLIYSDLKSNSAVFYIDVDGGGLVGPYTAARQ